MAHYKVIAMQDQVMEPIQTGAPNSSYLVARDDTDPGSVVARFWNQQQAQKVADALNAQGT